MAKKNLIVKCNVLFDGKSKLENKYVVIKDDKIVRISDNEESFDFEGVVTPAFIDAHSHIGMDRDGEPNCESEVNEHANQINPTIDPVNSIYFDDMSFKNAVDYGVLYSCSVPGSGNLLGGKAMIIKNFAKFRDEAVIKHYGYKMALGYNPRSTTEWKGERQNTRMGAYALLEKKFDEVLIKYEKSGIERDRKLNKLQKEKKDLTETEYDNEVYLIEKEFDVSFTPEEMELIELLSGEKTCKVHVHKDDDVRYLISLKEKYGIKVSAEHTCDVFNKETYDLLGENDIPVVFGPLGTVGYKVELKHAYYDNAKLLMTSKAFYGLMTDHPVVNTCTLRESLKFFLVQGMSEEEAISVITHKNAKILEIDDILGTVEEGKLASLVIWDRNPLHLAAYPKAVIAEGKVIRSRQGMLNFKISGNKKLQIEHLVLDFNGTLAIDGMLIDGVKEKLKKLAEVVKIHVITADTFGTVRKTLEDNECSIKVLDSGQQDLQKSDFVKALGAEKTVAIGNGLNDSLMLSEAVLGICVIQNECCAAKTLMNSDIVAKSIIDAFDLLLNPKRLNATLRK